MDSLLKKPEFDLMSKSIPETDLPISPSERAAAPDLAAKYDKAKKEKQVFVDLFNEMKRLPPDVSILRKMFDAAVGSPLQLRVLALSIVCEAHNISSAKPPQLAEFVTPDADEKYRRSFTRAMSKGRKATDYYGVKYRELAQYAETDNMNKEQRGAVRNKLALYTICSAMAKIAEEAGYGYMNE